MPFRRAFTLIELLVVIAIIAILAALVMPGLYILKKRQQTAATKTLIGQVSFAIGRYLSDYGRFGDDDENTAGPEAGSLNIQKPWTYLSVRPVADQKPAYLELKSEQVRRGGPLGPPDLIAGDCIVDAWMQPLRITVWNETRAGRTYLRRVDIASSMGTLDSTNDDLVSTYTIGEQGFRFRDNR